MSHEKRVLVVDDELAIRLMVIRILNSEGYLVTGCGHPQDALTALLRGDEYELIITDVGLPGMTGIELSRTILEHRPEQRLVIMSGDRKSLKPACDSGIPTITKPFDRQQFLRLVSETVAS